MNIKTIGSALLSTFALVQKSSAAANQLYEPISLAPKPKQPATLPLKAPFNQCPALPNSEEFRGDTCPASIDLEPLFTNSGSEPKRAQIKEAPKDPETKSVQLKSNSEANDHEQKKLTASNAAQTLLNTIKSVISDQDFSVLRCPGGINEQIAALDYSAIDALSLNEQSAFLNDVTQHFLDQLDRYLDHYCVSKSAHKKLDITEQKIDSLSGQRQDNWNAKLDVLHNELGNIAEQCKTALNKALQHIPRNQPSDQILNDLDRELEDAKQCMKKISIKIEKEVENFGKSFDRTQSSYTVYQNLVAFAAVFFPLFFLARADQADQNTASSDDTPPADAPGGNETEAPADTTSDSVPKTKPIVKQTVESLEPKAATRSSTPLLTDPDEHKAYDPLLLGQPATEPLASHPTSATKPKQTTFADLLAPNPRIEPEIDLTDTNVGSPEEARTSDANSEPKTLESLEKSAESAAQVAIAAKNELDKLTTLSEKNYTDYIAKSKDEFAQLNSDKSLDFTPLPATTASLLSGKDRNYASELNSARDAYTRAEGEASRTQQAVQDFQNSQTEYFVQAEAKFKRDSVQRLPTTEAIKLQEPSIDEIKAEMEQAEQESQTQVQHEESSAGSTEEKGGKKKYDYEGEEANRKRMSKAPEPKPTEGTVKEMAKAIDKDAFREAEILRHQGGSYSPPSPGGTSNFKL